MLKVNEVYKSFGQNEVLHGVDFSVARGEIHGLVGGNGAGKSTLMKIINGVYTKEQGSIFVDSKEVNYDTAIGAQRAGISMVYQEFSLIPSMSVADNLFLARELRKGHSLFIDRKVAVKRALEVFARLKVKIDPMANVEDLSVGNMQLVEIAKAMLSNDTKILILDEPTASLSNVEIDSLFQTMKELKEKGISIILVSHHLQEIMDHCDSVTVLRDGISALTKPIADTTLNEIIAAMLGEEVTTHEYHAPSIERSAEPILEVKHLSWRNRVKDVSFNLYGGEVVGLVGVMSSGRTELLNMIYGLSTPDTGEIYLRGKRIKPRHPKESIDYGISMVPEDRRTCGIIGMHSIRMNVLLPIWNRIKLKLFICDQEGKKLAAEYIQKLEVKCQGTEEQMGNLSGGNQQKVVFAKSIISEPEVLLLDDPTVGIDIAAKAGISRTIRQFADSGKAVLLVSGEFDEIAKVADRVLIIINGRVKKEISRKEAEISEASLIAAVYER